MENILQEKYSEERNVFRLNSSQTGIHYVGEKICRVGDRARAFSS